MKIENRKYYSDVQSLLDAMDATVVETDTVLDVGCGIVPMNYFRPKLHIMVEPWDEYSNILRQRHADDKSVLILKLDALEALFSLHDKSIDSVFLLDVIEHLEKDAGVRLVAEIERVTRRQAVIFTPLGFMPQHLEADESDAWGLSGGQMQEHKSGWLPEDFGPQWEFHICKNYHEKDFRGELLEIPYGAFFAICNFQDSQSRSFTEIPDIRRPLPSEITLQKLQVSMAELTDLNSNLMEENTNLKTNLATSLSELDKIKSSGAFKFAKLLHNLFSPRPR